MTRPMYPFGEWDFRTSLPSMQLIKDIGGNNYSLVSGYGLNEDINDPIASPLGYVFNSINGMITTQNQLYGYYNNRAPGFSFSILVNPTNLEIASSGRNMLFDFSINGVTTSSSTAWFTGNDTVGGFLRFGGRSSNTDSFYSKTTNTSIATNNIWVNCGGVMDFTNKLITVYKNGKQVEPPVYTAFSSNTYIHNATSYTYLDRIGISLNYAYPFSGTMMYLILYPRALTATEMHNLYLYIQSLAAASGVLI